MVKFKSIIIITIILSTLVGCGLGTKAELLYDGKPLNQVQDTDINSTKDN